MVEFLTIKHVLWLTALVWHYALFCGFVSDDHAVIEARKDIIPDGEKVDRKEKYWLKVFNDGIVMFYLNKILRRLSGRVAFGWHLFNFLLHLLNTYLFYLVAIMLVGDKVAIFATLIWSVHPMHNQIVVWCSGRPYGIATTLALLMAIWWRHPLVAFPLYVLGSITNVSIGFMPILLKMMHPDTWQGNAYIIAMFAMAPFVVWKFSLRFGRHALVLDRKNFRFKWKRFNNIVRVYMYYIFSIIFPVKMGWYHEGGFRYNSDWDKFNVWGVIGYVTIVLLTKSGIGGVWFLLGMLPNMNLFVTNSYLQDRYLYFGTIGLALLAAPYLYQYPVLFIAAVAIYGFKSYNYSRQMVSDERLYRENVRNHPASDYAYNNLGFFLIQQRRYEEARALVKRGLAINRHNKLLWYNLGITWAATAHLKTEEGKFRFLRAMDCWKMALQIEPRWAKPYEDLQKMLKFLVDNKVLVQDTKNAMPNSPSIDIPVGLK